MMSATQQMGFFQQLARGTVCRGPMEEYRNMIRTETIPVYGMMCEHCVKAVTMALQALDGVQGVQVSLEANSATVTFDDGTASLEKFREAIIEEGYSLEPVQQAVSSPEEP